MRPGQGPRLTWAALGRQARQQISSPPRGSSRSTQPPKESRDVVTRLLPTADQPVGAGLTYWICAKSTGLTEVTVSLHRRRAKGQAPVKQGASANRAHGLRTRDRG